MQAWTRVSVVSSSGRSRCHSIRMQCEPSSTPRILRDDPFSSVGRIAHCCSAGACAIAPKRFSPPPPHFLPKGDRFSIRPVSRPTPPVESCPPYCPCTPGPALTRPTLHSTLALLFPGAQRLLLIDLLDGLDPDLPATCYLLLAAALPRPFSPPNLKIVRASLLARTAATRVGKVQ